MREVKRKANVGGRIKIVNPSSPLDPYGEGDVFTVKEVMPYTVGVNEHAIPILHKEYVVLEDDLDIIANLARRVADLEKRVKALESEKTVSARNIPAKPQLTRDEIIERAKRDVEYLMDYVRELWDFNVEFVVNRDKRTIVALLRNPRDNGKVIRRSKAKCAPQDCFNVHIGKAIALRRALFKTVPDEYLNAPQPTEVRVGDLVMWSDSSSPYIITEGMRVVYTKDKRDYTAYANLAFAKVIDDSREEVAEQ